LLCIILYTVYYIQGYEMLRFVDTRDWDNLGLMGAAWRNKLNPWGDDRALGETFLIWLIGCGLVIFISLTWIVSLPLVSLAAVATFLRQRNLRINNAVAHLRH